MQLQRDLIILTEKEVRRRPITYNYHLSMESKLWHNQTYLWNRNRTVDIWDWWLPRGREPGWSGRLRLADAKPFLHVEWINNKVLLNSTGNYIYYPMINNNGKIFQKCIGRTFLWHSSLYIRNCEQCKSAMKVSLSVMSDSLQAHGL